MEVFEAASKSVYCLNWVCIDILYCLLRLEQIIIFLKYLNPNMPITLTILLMYGIEHRHVLHPIRLRAPLQNPHLPLTIVFLHGTDQLRYIVLLIQRLKEIAQGPLQHILTLPLPIQIPIDTVPTYHPLPPLRFPHILILILRQHRKRTIEIRQVRSIGELKSQAV